MFEFLAAAFVLVVIVATSMYVEALWKKVFVFLSLGILVGAALWNNGDHGSVILYDVFAVDYVQFVGIPVATVLIACLGLFSLRARDEQGIKLGWFLWLACPFIANVATTWALVPAGLSLAAVLRATYPDRWFRILIAVCAFSMNFLALGTLAADPPQAYWAVKAANHGESLGFFYPLGKFWVYLGLTMAVYYVTLRRFGVEFGHPANLLAVRPAHWGKMLYGIGIALCVILAVTLLKGYEVSVFLGVVCLIVGVSAFLFFGEEERQQTLHWTVETMAIFIAFFSVVALAHAGLHHLRLTNQGMMGVVIGMTLFADNAAAFAAGYPQFSSQGEMHLVWYNLFNSVTYGGISPLGNGPQIALFLIVLVHRKDTNPREVFVTWFKEACVFAPYLLVWSLGLTCLIEFGFPPTAPAQMLVGLVAMTVCFQFMDLQRLFRAHVDDDDNNGAA